MIETLLPDDEADLRWLYTESRGACGMRSGMGGAIAAATAMSKLKPPPVGVPTMYVGKDKPARVGNVTEDAIIRIVERGSASRASAIEARLRRLPRCHQATLEAQFSMITEIPGTGVSPLLATKQVYACTTYRELARRKRKKKGGSNSTATPLLWIAHLVNRAREVSTGDEAVMLGTILAQARTALNSACKAYNAAKGRV